MSETVTISVNRALTNIKNLNKELETYFQTPRQMLGLSYGSSGKITSQLNVEAVGLASAIQSNYDKGANIIARITLYKQLIAASNAVTTVQINGKDITVADAIIKKANIGNSEKFLNYLRKCRQSFQEPHKDALKKYEDRVQAMFNASVDQTQSTESKNTAFVEVEKQQNVLIYPNIIDPVKLDEKITDLENEINFLKNELDFVLSTSNTTTMLNVPVNH